MFILTKRFRFEASHQLMHHDGKCANLHGHSWVLSITVKGYHLEVVGPKKNMMIDYGTISEIVKPYVQEFLDHHHLNEKFSTDSPTSEFLAWQIYHALSEKIPGLHRVGIQETDTAEVEYGVE